MPPTVYISGFPLDWTLEKANAAVLAQRERITRLTQELEAADARVSELEKERDALKATVDGITQKALGDPRTSVSVKGVGSYVPNPPVKGE